MTREFYLPYIINLAQPNVEEIVIFCVAVLIAVLVSAESQAFVATLLGDARPGAKDRLNFNAFAHLSILGTLCFFVGGFGWAKKIDIDPSKFKISPRVGLILSRLSGPMANLLMANIAASLTWILGRWGFQDQVFSTIVVVNVSMAIYGLLFVPPLPGASVLKALLPAGNGIDNLWKTLQKVGPVLLVGAFLLMRFTGYEGVSSFFNPIVSSITTFALNI